MPKKPPSKRLDELFENIKDEATPPARKSARRTTARLPEKKVRPPSIKPPIKSAGQTGALPPLDTIALTQPGTPGAPATMSLGFKLDSQNWATIQVVDEVSERKWGVNEQLLVKQVTDQLSQALENARLFQETERRAEELSILNELGQTLSSQFQFDEIIDTIYQGLSRLLNARNFYVALYDSKTNEIIFPRNVSESDLERGITRLPMGKGITAHIISTGESVMILDGTDRWLAEHDIELVGEPAKSFLGVPLMRGREVLGVMAIQDYNHFNIYDEHSQRLLTAFANQASIAIENARLFQEARTHAEELTVLNELTAKLSARLDVSQVLQEIYLGVARLLDARNFYIGLYAPEKEEVTLPLVVSESVLDSQIRSIHSGQGLTGHIIRTRAPLVIPRNVKEAMDSLGIEAVGDLAKSWLGVPLLLGEQVIGVMAVQSYTDPDVYDEHARDLLLAFAGQAAIAIQNARLFEETERRAEELGTLNRVISTASQILDLESLLQSTLKQAMEVSGFEGGLISLYDETAGKLNLTTHYNLPQPILTSLTTKGFANTPCEYVYQTREILALGDLREGAPLNVSGLIASNILSYLGIPLEAKGRIIGTLCMFNSEPRVLEPRLLELTRSIGIQIGLSIENVRLFETTQRSEAELRALFLAMTDVIIVYDRDGRYVRIAPTNPSRLFRPPDEMLGKKISDILPESMHKPFLDTIQRALEGGQLERIEYPLVIEDSQYWFEANVSKLTGEQVFWVARDITARKQAEEEIRKFKLGIDQSTDVVFTTDIEGLITYTNPAFEKTYGFSLDEALGKTPRILKSGLMSMEYYQRLWSTLLNKQTISSDEIVNKARDGHLVYVSETNSPILDESGNILGFLSVHHDITDRKIAEQEIRKFKLGIDQSSNAVFTTDTDGTITYVNPGFEKVYGYSFAEAVGKTPRIIKSGLLSDDNYKQFWNTLLNKQTVTGEIINKAKDGRLVSIAGTNSPILNENGEVLGFLAVHHDITDLKQAEDALKRRNDYLNATAEIGRLVTSTLDMPTLFSRTVNLVCERFGFYHAGIFITEETGFNAILRAATGEAGAEMLHREHKLAVGSKSVVGQATETGQPVVVNDTTASPTHRYNPLLPETQSEIAIPLHVGSRTIGALDIQSTSANAFSENDIAVLQTLADQVAIAIDNARSYELSMQAVKEMREADRLKSQFLANMSHELRTPLNSIIGFSRVILKGIDGPTTDLQQQDLLAIHNSGQHLLRLINDILDLSRIEAGKMELTFDEVNLSDLIASVMSTVTGLVKDKPITLRRDLPADLPTVRADAMRVRQVLLNLLSNAAKFTDEGSITVHASMQANPAGHPEILVNVVDTGPGISPEDQKKLFQPFSQVDASPTRKTGGSGLGLSISSHLIQLHGGRIGVDSKVGTGSTFYFTIPAFRGTTIGASEPPTNKVILAIDDDPQVISLYERYLQPQAYQVVALTDPSRAVERARMLKPFAITLDIMMPGYDGWRVLNELKSNAETRDIPVIICSIVEEQARGFNLGAADYLLKPILEDDLLGALDRLNADGSIQEVLVIDDDPNDLRLISKMVTEHGRYRSVAVEGGLRGWDAILARTPHAVILDLFMPDLDGFTIIERMRSTEHLRDVPVIIVSGGELTNEQKIELKEFSQRMLLKSTLDGKQLLNTLERALKRVKS